MTPADLSASRAAFDTGLTDLQRELFTQLRDQRLMTRAAEMGRAYLAGIEDRAVAPDKPAMAALGAFDEPLPRHVGDAADVLDMLDHLGSPATMAQLGGRYFGFVTGSALPVALARRILADHWDQNAGLAAMSPIAARLEEVAERWLTALFGLPQGSAAGFVSGSSTATLAGLAAGRWRLYQRLGWDFNARGYQGAPPLRVVTGRHTHATVQKMISLLGFGLDHVEYADVDDQGRVTADGLPPLDDRTLLILQAGNVTSGSFDDFAAILPLAQQAGAWVHVDGAFGLWAGACAQTRHLTRGAELADSFSVDAHKTLNVPYDCGIVLCRDRAALQSALHATGSYIQQGEARDSMFLTPEMSRRARGVELWAALKYLGTEGIDALVGQLCTRARQAAENLAGAGFGVLNDVVFNQVVIGCAEGERDALLATLQAGGEVWAGPGVWFDRPVIRISVCSWATTPTDITRATAAFVAARAAVGERP